MGLISNGTTLLDAGAIDSGVATGSLVLLSTSTASSSATIDFTSGIDSTYKEYIFKFIDIHLATDGAEFTFQADTGTNTNYNQTITSTYYLAEHNEADTSTGYSYQTSRDQAQATGFQHFGVDVGADNDHCIAGFLHIFEPSSTTFVKHFLGTMQQAHQNDLSLVGYIGGYFNTTTAITRFRFKASSGNVDAGTIKMYGVK
tara:strand:+ start:105 stop:707 length:603 start_codon:yes stop_codon:yes gene_type:complete